MKDRYSKLINRCVVSSICLLVLLVLLTNACTKSGIIIETNPEPIAEVTEIRLERTTGIPPQLIINAKGLAGSAGWKNSVLVQYDVSVPPEDGIYEFEFRAYPPEEASATVLTPIEVAYVLDPLPDDLLGVRVFAETNSKLVLLENTTAYFEFKGSDETDRFVIKLTDPEKIQHARGLLSNTESENRSVVGTIVKQQVAYNSDWHYHLDEASIEFFDVAVEVCDATMAFVEVHLNEVGGSFLPNNIWCPWGSELSRELFISD